ncbi:MAG: hypothetical protein AAF408_10035 [Pseudomonadota bacterium]
MAGRTWNFGSMARVEDIEDRETLLAWLEQRPEQSRWSDAIKIASRCALRVLPHYLTFVDHEEARFFDMTALPIFRLNLISAVVGKFDATELAEAVAASISVGASSIADISNATRASSAKTRSAANAALEAISAARSVSSLSAAGSAAAAAARATSEYSIKPRADSWRAVREDVQLIESGQDILHSPLWPHLLFYRAVGDWRSCKRWLTVKPGYDFWVHWYDTALDGRPVIGDWDRHWYVLRAIAEIPEDDWKQGAEHIAALIEAIIESDAYHVSDETLSIAETLLKSALGRFGFDEIRHLMELLPFADDLRLLREPDHVDAFIRDIDQQRREIETFLRALDKESGNLQGAGSIHTYFEAILEEVTKSRQLSQLNIGWMVVCGEILQGFAQREETLAELGPLSIPFKRTLDNLLDLIHQHFSATILRFATLRDIRSSEDTNLSDLMQDLRRGFDVIKSEAEDDRVPMAPEARAVFDLLLDETDALIKREFLAADPSLKGDLRKDIDYRMAQVSVSLRLYLEQSQAPRKAVSDIVKGVAKKKVAKSTEGLVDWFIDALKGGGS